MADVGDYLDGAKRNAAGCADKMAAEVALLREMPTLAAEQLENRFHTAQQRPEEIARDIGMGMLVGGALGAISHNPELSRTATACMMTPFALDLMRRVGAPISDVWRSTTETTLSSARFQMGRDVGDMIFDYAIGAVSGGIAHDFTQTRFTFANRSKLAFATDSAQLFPDSPAASDYVLQMSGRRDFLVPARIPITGKFRPAATHRQALEGKEGDLTIVLPEKAASPQGNAEERVRHDVKVLANTSSGKQWLTVDVFACGLRDLVYGMNTAHLETKTPFLREALESAQGQSIRWDRHSRSYLFEKPLSPPDSFLWKFPSQFSALQYRGAGDERPRIATKHAYPQQGDTWFKFVTGPKKGNAIPGVIAPRICNGDAWFHADISSIVTEKDLSFESKKQGKRKARNLAFKLSQVEDPTFKAELRDNKWIYVLQSGPGQRG